VKSKAKAKSAPKREAAVAARKADVAPRKTVRTPRSPLLPRARSEKSNASAQPAALEIPREVENATLTVDGGPVSLTNLSKIYFPELGLT